MTPEQWAAQAIKDSEPVEITHNGQVAQWLVLDRLEAAISACVQLAVRDEQRACAALLDRMPNPFDEPHCFDGFEFCRQYAAQAIRAGGIMPPIPTSG